MYDIVETIQKSNANHTGSAPIVLIMRTNRGPVANGVPIQSINMPTKELIISIIRIEPSLVPSLIPRINLFVTSAPPKAINDAAEKPASNIIKRVVKESRLHS